MAQPEPHLPGSFTGQTRRRSTRPAVKMVDRIARTLITVGGMGTILAVVLIFVFLTGVVLPLFLPGEVRGGAALESESHPSRILRIGVDEYRVLVWILRADGSLTIHRHDTGEKIETRQLFPEAPPVAVGFGEGTGQLVFGFADGTIRLGRIHVATQFLPEDDLPEELADLPPGTPLVHDGAMVEMTSERQLRAQRVEVSLDEPTLLTRSGPIRLLGLNAGDRETLVVAFVGEDKLIAKQVRRRYDMLADREILTLSGGELTLAPDPEEGVGAPAHLLVGGLGSYAFLVWPNGRLLRVNTTDARNPEEAEGLPSVLSDRSARVTAVRFLAGKSTILIGESTGTIRAWFPVRPEDAETIDGTELVMAHEFVGSAAVTSLAPSGRSRIFLAGYADGSARLFHSTSRESVAEIPDPAGGGSVLAAEIAPKEDGLLLATETGLFRHDLAPGYPEVTLPALFGAVWYEGYPDPEHVWQSTGGTDEFEPKFGVMPLVFGTLKATAYSMLFGLPLALLAAIFASEFLHPRVKSKIKPTIEIMASLPSVILGFLAALVIAPFVEEFIPAVLGAFLAIPLCVLVGAHIWQLLPTQASLRMARLRLPVIGATVVVGIVLSALLGPVLEDFLFAGDLRQWLTGGAGGAWGGWFFLLFPAGASVVAIAISRGVGPRLRRLSSAWERPAVAQLDLVKFGGGVLAALLITAILASLLSVVGVDPRGSVVGTYVQRNALVVGFVMGFAIIPIIFTIAEDALSAVPEHLRSASLGAGATPWQTAVRIIIPTAASGLFSAIMIGLGRAVGETMIVLMAAGNTPLMDWNIFNGFRTLSANLAVELPEAPVGGTHYRVLFLGALLLFLMTFVLNTIAEVVRLRFRKRAYQL